jgi:ABC-type nitrate/sulfonate/bicarbonate transport system ATPase subunit
MERTTRIKVEGVYKAFVMDGLRLDVLAGVSLHVLNGEFVSLIGPSGCGKSTLLNIIAGLDSPDAGVIRCDGLKTDTRLGEMGYMQQKDLLMPWRSVLQNAILPLELRGVSRAQAVQQAMEMIEVTGLGGFERQLPSTLSGGMRQRVAFLRTLLAGRDVLLLDEPFGALDALTRSQMQEWLLGLWGSLKKTIMLVTHDVEEALLLSDRVYVLTGRPGRVRAEVSVALPRPRKLDVTNTQEFISLKRQLLVTLREEG